MILDRDVRLTLTLNRKRSERPSVRAAVDVAAPRARMSLPAARPKVPPAAVEPVEVDERPGMDLRRPSSPPNRTRLIDEKDPVLAMMHFFKPRLVAALTSILALALVPRLAVAADGGNVVEAARQHFLSGVLSTKMAISTPRSPSSAKRTTRPDYRVLYNIGQVHAERRDHAAATKALRQYLKEGGSELDSERRAAVEQSLAEMAKRIGFG